jgi:hypothetical protein
MHRLDRVASSHPHVHVLHCFCHTFNLSKKLTLVSSLVFQKNQIRNINIKCTQTSVSDHIQYYFTVVSRQYSVASADRPLRSSALRGLRQPGRDRGGADIATSKQLQEVVLFRPARARVTVRKTIGRVHLAFLCGLCGARVVRGGCMHAFFCFLSRNDSSQHCGFIRAKYTVNSLPSTCPQTSRPRPWLQAR